MHPPPGEGRRARSFRPDIEGLRAVAVLLVVLGHSGLGVPGGYVGVDVFFVISGFLITQQLLKERARAGRISLRAFYARRARRIIPAAAVVIVATVAASWCWLSPLRLRAIAVDGMYAAFSAVNLRLAEAGTDYFQADGPPSPFQHYWSLAVEEQFYLVWPLLLILATLAASGLAARRPGAPPGVADGGPPAGTGADAAAGRAVVFALLAVTAGSFALSVLITARSAPWAYFGGHTRAWELALGALVAAWAGAFGRMPRALSAQLTWLGLAGIVAAAFLLDDSTPYPGSAALLPVLAAAFVVAGGCAAPPRGAELLLGRAAPRVIGRLSYSWYLWHWPVLRIWPEATGRPFTTGQKLAAIAVSLVLAALTYWLVENPVRRRPGLVRRPVLGIGLGVALAGVASGTALVVAAVATVPGGGAAGPPKPLAVAGGEARANGPAAVETRFVGVGTSALTPLIEESLGIRALPDGLQPSLRDAPDDFRANKCYTSIASSTPTDCVYGDPAGPTTVVLLGDSHANQWFNAMNAIGQERHWRVIPYMKGGCPPAAYPDFYLEALKRVYTECETWRAAVLEKIAELRPALVVVGSEARTNAIHAGPRPMAELMRTLRSTGARVAFLEDTPYPGFAVPDCLARHPSKVGECVVPISASKLTEPQREVENRGARDGGATLVDPVPWLCARDSCPPIIGNTIVYYDKSHVTGTYSTLLAPFLGPALAAVLE
ncbi:acyltransferase [Frankia sp. CNm7]|uniref:Acyltransferase n=1 Tax=Frankia nepalensis TaxID=1836974 RepID=A0A937RCC5_9ACTN|nr:acyltransferase family protein [Frankia nepalensis]MBL7501222.1 acyltransferase [Frankia nepalensis]MBL7516402.1 acyltransferase [Frankia nepalensis]MBL7518304.1 acyltransferase [Frankia nepalensis]MBL7629508.1 acyltransferase [Frankia nepalensis]